MPGYSETSLQKKLGIKPGFRMWVLYEPKEYWEWISPLPDETTVLSTSKAGSIDFIHVFATEHKSLEFGIWKKALNKTGMIWISWPKKSAGMVSDLDENKIREMGLQAGLVDVKVCSIDETWSGLKFVYRLKDR
jgi:hypothetical protein